MTVAQHIAHMLWCARMRLLQCAMLYDDDDDVVCCLNKAHLLVETDTPDDVCVCARCPQNGFWDGNLFELFVCL